MWKHWETPHPPPVSKVVYLWTVHWRMNGIQEMVISLLYHIRICAVFRNQFWGTTLISLSSWWSAFFPHILHMVLTSVGQNSVKLNLQGCWLLLACFSPHPIPCFHAVWMGWREGPGRRESAGDGLVGWNSCASLFKAVGMVIFHSFICYNIYWSTVALKCCVGFHCTAKWISYTYTYIPSLLDFLPI